MAFEAIHHEIEQLHGVSSRLEALAELHPTVTEALLTIAGTVRDAAVVLAVLIATRTPRPL